MGSIGPNSYLPGQVVKAFRGTMCESEGHEHIQAAYTVIGESDSFGSETNEMCQECYDKYRKELEEQKNDPDFQQPLLECEASGCGSTDDVKAIRDPDEGCHGPVHHWCKACRKSLTDYHSEQSDTDYSDYPDY